MVVSGKNATKREQAEYRISRNDGSKHVLEKLNRGLIDRVGLYSNVITCAWVAYKDARTNGHDFGFSDDSVFNCQIEKDVAGMLSNDPGFPVYLGFYVRPEWHADGKDVRVVIDYFGKSAVDGIVSRAGPEYELAFSAAVDCGSLPKAMSAMEGLYAEACKTKGAQHLMDHFMWLLNH
jgi:hypothetical protein